jgi:2Fe-2S ferredoxin
MPIASSCGGEGVCLACRIRVVEGSENLSELAPRELEVMKRGVLENGERLACLAYVYGPVSITTTYW